MSASDGSGIRGLYLHVPFCDGKCSYCAFYSVPADDALAGRYLEAVRREFELCRAQWTAFTPETVYVGGGTPTVLSAGRLEELCGVIRAGIDPAAVLEWTVEANPGTVDAEKLAVLQRAGVNRLSLGAQSMDDAVLARLGRRHRAADVERACEAAREAGFLNLGLDLIASVPGVGEADWRRTLERAAGLQPMHVSVYALTAEEGSHLAALARDGAWAPPGEEEQLAALGAAEEALAAANYRRYEISNYARPGFECLHNLECWRGVEYLGLGPAAASNVGPKRWTNRPDLEAYLAFCGAGALPPREEELLGPVARTAERLAFGLRMAEGVDLEEIVEQTGLAGSSWHARWRRILEEMERYGVMRPEGRRHVLTARGRCLADRVGAEMMLG